LEIRLGARVISECFFENICKLGLAIGRSIIRSRRRCSFAAGFIVCFALSYENAFLLAAENNQVVVRKNVMSLVYLLKADCSDSAILFIDGTIGMIGKSLSFVRLPDRFPVGCNRNLCRVSSGMRRK